MKNNMQFEFERIDMAWLLDMAIAGIAKCGYEALDPRQLELYFELRNAVMFDNDDFIVEVK